MTTLSLTPVLAGSVTLTAAAAADRAFSSAADLAFEADNDLSGSGDVVLKTKGVERVRVKPDGLVRLLGDGTSAAKQQLLFVPSQHTFGAAIDYKENLFGSDNIDPTLYVGLNQTANGTVISSADPGLSWGFEGDFVVGGVHKMEVYLQWRAANNAGAAIRPIFIQLDRDTGATTAFALSGDDVRVNSAAGATRLQMLSGNVNLFPNTGTAHPAGIKAFALYADGGSNGTQLYMGHGATIDSFRVQTDTATQSQFRINGKQVMSLYRVGSGDGIAVSVGGVNENGQMLLVDAKNRGDAAAPVLIARAATVQTAAIIRVEAQDKTLLGGFNKDGYLFTRKTSAPADRDLAAGELAVWFDSPDGSAKAMFKGKSANGTVVAGEVALS